jgi:ribose/xylose/arabinose/galactoside ABC-type transport system permease subunit
VAASTPTASPEDQAPGTAAEQFADRRSSPVQRIQHLLHKYPALSPLIVLVLSWLFFAQLSDRFSTAAGFSLVLQQASIVAALAIGQTLIVLTAGIDLSVGFVAIYAAVIAATANAEWGLPALLAVVGGVAVGAAAGLFNGLLVTVFKLPPFIATLGTLSIFQALGLLLTKGQSIQGKDMGQFMQWTGTTIEFGDFKLTYGVLIVIAMYAVVSFALSQTQWGRHVYAVGNDIEAARLSGIRVNRVLVSVYAAAGAIYGLTAWLMIGRATAASTNAIPEANLETITAVVIGGISLFGGRGVLIGTALGALIVNFFNFGLAMAGIDAAYRILSIGILILVAVAVDQWIRRVRT